MLGVIQAQELLIDRTLTLINSQTKSSTVFDELIDELKIAGDRADSQWQKVVENQEIQDQLMRRGIHLE